MLFRTAHAAVGELPLQPVEPLPAAGGVPWTLFAAVSIAAKPPLLAIVAPPPDSRWPASAGVGLEASAYQPGVRPLTEPAAFQW